jgi:kinesin family protein 2/24
MDDSEPKIKVVVRKRPLNSKERKRKDPDILAQRSPYTMIVREEKVKVDLTKFIEEHHFTFDEVFDEMASNEEIYRRALQPLINAAFSGAKVACFAYGQTGSGKTYTMMGEESAPGMYLLAAQDLFYLRDSYYPNYRIWISFYEIYCSKLHDLLNERNELFARVDARQNVNIVGLQRKMANNVEDLMRLIEYGMGARTVGQTGANDDSSRSHAVLEICLREANRIKGKMTFIDLAGSERGADVKDSDRQTRLDSAEINKSLLALKECIRALDQDKRHTPFRGSKLTQVLKDSFIGNCRTVMFANVSPTLSACEHTLNTLRYADRVKELRKPPSSRAESSNIMMLPRQDSNSVRYQNEPKPDFDFDQPSPVHANPMPYKPPVQYSAPQPMAKPTPPNKNLIPASPKSANKPSGFSGIPKDVDIEELSAKHEDLIAVILSEEEELINDHRKMIDQMVDMIKHEMSMLTEVDQPGSDVDHYAQELDKILSLKEEMIRSLREKVHSFNTHLREEEEMSKFFNELQKEEMDLFDLSKQEEDLLEDFS